MRSWLQEWLWTVQRTKHWRTPQSPAANTPETSHQFTNVRQQLLWLFGLVQNWRDLEIATSTEKKIRINHAISRVHGT